MTATLSRRSSQPAMSFKDKVERAVREGHPGSFPREWSAGTLYEYFEEEWEFERWYVRESRKFIYETLPLRRIGEMFANGKVSAE